MHKRRPCPNLFPFIRQNHGSEREFLMRHPFPNLLLLKWIGHGLGEEFWTRHTFLLRLVTVQHTIDEIIKAINLPLSEQAVLPAHRLTTKVARPRKGRKKTGGGL